MYKHINILTVLLAICFANVNLLAQLDAPVLRSVSIDPATNHVILKWDNPQDSNVSHIEISRRIYSGNLYSFDSIAAVPVPLTSFIDNTVTNLDTERQTYRIRSHGNTDKSSITPMHVTSLVSAAYSQCENRVAVNWTLYRQVFVDANGSMVEPHEPEETFNKAIKYEVWGYYGNGAFDITQAIKLGKTNNGDVYTDTISNLAVNETYHLFLKAILPNNDTVTSYRIEVETSARREPAYINVDSVISVNGNIELYFGIDPNSQLDTFALYRNDITNRPIYWYYGAKPEKYTDSDIQLGMTYSYHLGVFRCGNLVKTSDTVNNIILLANSMGQSVRLRWSEFVGQSSIYTLTRTMPEPPSVYIAGGVFEYTDDIKYLLENGNFQYCYTLTAFNGVSTARSEPRCVTVEPMVSMPDAIDPKSDYVNPVTGRSRNLFGPILSFNDDKYRFSLEIFNRSGTRIFRSVKEFNDPVSNQHYWDGRYNNDYVREDVYIYSLKFEFKDRKPYTQNGTVTVIYR